MTFLDIALENRLLIGTTTGTVKRSLKKMRRDTLIPVYSFPWGSNQGKMRRLWEELQFNLFFNRHELAIPATYRSLIELATARYMDKHRLPDKKSLAKNVRLVAEHLQGVGALSKNEEADLLRMSGSSGSHRELEAIHRVVHSNSFSLSKADLIALWDGFEKYLVESIKN